MRKIGLKGFRVVQTRSGKKVLERIPFYGRDSSARIRMRKSKKATPVRPAFAGLVGKGEGSA